MSYATDALIDALERNNKKLEAENARLRDAMYSNAKRHALQHMGEDELRIWATQQAEHIKELREENRALRKSLKQRELDAVLRENEAEKMMEVLESCAILLTDREFLHWPELLEETLKDMREWGIEVPVE